MNIGIRQDSEWLLDPRYIVLDNEVTKGHGLIWVELDVLFINATKKVALHNSGLGIKADDDFGGVVITR